MVRPKPDQPDRLRRPWCMCVYQCVCGGGVYIATNKRTNDYCVLLCCIVLSAILHRLRKLTNNFSACMPLLYATRRSMKIIVSEGHTY